MKVDLSIYEPRAFGDAVKQYRIHCRISLREAARQVGVSASTIRRIEGGDNNTSQKTMAKFMSTWGQS